MKRRLFPLVLSFGAVFFFGVMWYLMHDKNIAILNPKGEIAAQQKDLILFTTALGMVVIIPVFVMLFVFIKKYSATNTSAKYTPDDEGSRTLESIWWGIPIAIIVVLSVVTWVTTHKLDPYRAIESDKRPLQVQVIALQWRWLFLYPELGVASINELRIPTDRPVEFSISADAPMSAFWIPNLGSQTYAMNGMSSKLSLIADEPGTYRGANSNISGEGYADMVFATIATPERDFAQWTQRAASSPAKLDWAKYTTLAEPAKKTPVQYFTLEDKGLYDEITGQYMSHDGNFFGKSSEDNHEMMGH